MSAHASLDTSVVLRLLLADIPDLHRRALRLFSSPDATFAVSDLAFVETTFALERHYRLTRAQIAEMITSFAALDNISCHTDQLLAAIATWVGHPKLSFEDCLMAEYAQREAMTPLWTFDRKLANQHQAAVEVP